VFKILWHDCESVGLCGPVKLNQYAVDDGPVHMFAMLKGWENDEKTCKEIWKLLDLIDRPDTLYVGFNAAFDLFHLYRIKHRLLGYEYDSPERPVAPFRCKVLDLQIPAMLTSPLAPFAFTRANGKSVALLRRIPKVAQEIVAQRVAAILKPLLPDSFELGVGVHAVPKKKDLVTLSFNVKGRLSLKGLMAEYGFPTLKLADCWPLPEKGVEKQWLPYPDPAIHDQIEIQCDWVLNGPKDSAFYRYAELDILYLKVLYEKLGCPTPDYESSCVHNIAYLRYYGIDVDRKALEKAKRYYAGKVNEIEAKLVGVNLRSSKDRLVLLQPHFPILASTAKKVLKKLATEDSEGGRLCAAILDYGPSRQRLLQIEKVLECRTGKAHPSLRVMGTATNRMAGEAGLNWQGIGAADEVLGSQLTDELIDCTQDTDSDGLDFDEELEEVELLVEDRKCKVGLRAAILTPCVGDWASFEVGIAAQVYGDKQLQEDLDNGIDLHCMVTVQAHPKCILAGLEYEEVLRIYKDSSDPQHHMVNGWRKSMKAIVFGIFYFVSAMKVAETLGIADYEGQAVMDRVFSRYPGIQEYRRAIEAAFITADTQFWSKGSVSKMETRITDLTGFSRNWDFEKSVAEAMWKLGSEKSIKTGLSGSVIRTQEKGAQSVDNAIVSACLGSAIALQAACSRQAGNMKVQATGASINKMLGAYLWETLRVPTLQIHDELFPPHHPNYQWESYTNALEVFQAAAKEIVKQVKFDYKSTERWSDK